MGFETFIANKTAFSTHNSFTKTIVRVAIAGIALSMAIIIITSSTLTGFKSEITKNMFGFWGHLQIIHSSAAIGYDSKPISNKAEYIQKILDIKQASLERFSSESREEKPTTWQSKGGIEHIQSLAISPAVLRTKDNFESVLVRGIAQDFKWDLMRNFLVRGEPIRFSEDHPSDDIILSESISKRLQLDIGDKIVLNFIKGRKQIPRRLVVRGIYKTGLEEYDARFVIADIKEVQNILGWEPDEVRALEVYIDDLDDLEGMNEYIYLKILPNNVYSKTIRELHPQIFVWLDLQDMNEVIIFTLMLLVAIINMITTLIILIIERRTMVGVLKALGSTNWGIRKVFLYTAAHIIFYGLLIGNVLGIGLCLIQKHFKIITLDEANYYLNYAPIKFNFPSILLYNGLTILTILLVLILPSIIISKIAPVRVLHFK